MKSTGELSLLFYLGGHNDLAGNVERLAAALARPGLPAWCSLAAQWDSGRGPGAGGRRYLSRGGKTCSEALGSLDSSSNEVLGEFIHWAMASAPAEHSVLFIFGHSDGFLGLLEDEGTGREMTIPDFRRALEYGGRETGKTIDAIVFDCCWMSMIEVLFEIEGLCRYVMASQEEVLGDGLPLGMLLSSLSRLPAGTGLEEKLAALFRAVYEAPCHSAGSSALLFMPAFSLVSMAPIKRLKQRLCGMAESIAGLGGEEAALFRSCLEKTQHSGNFGYREEPYQSFIDIVDLCARILDEPGLPASVRKAASSAALAVEEAVKGHGRWGDETRRFHGLSLFFPLSREVFDEHEDYLRLRWAAKSPWPGAISRICGPGEERHSP